jgi:PhzF family phenazine biosynthesis protein
MNLPIFQVDAFTDHLFGGNPAAVVPLEKWLPDLTMQNIASENNLSETAFFVKESSGYHIRWFTPLAEVSLCGHATLASAHVLFNHLDFSANLLEFQSGSGILRVKREGEMLTLDFPSDRLREIDPPDDVIHAIGMPPMKALQGRTDFMLVYSSQEEIEQIKPDMNLLLKTNARGVIITAPGKDVDFVSRFFAPQVGVPEDPVTGSAHTTLTPYWSNRLNKLSLQAIQLSKRKGHLTLKMTGDRVEISGKAVTYLEGKIFIVS